VSDLVDPEERRARCIEARGQGRMCGGCGRALAVDETVWRVRLEVGGRTVTAWTKWLVPVGVECVSADVLRATEGRELEPCFGCGRGVHDLVPHHRRRSAACSQRCRSHYLYLAARGREGQTS